MSPADFLRHQENSRQMERTNSRCTRQMSHLTTVAPSSECIGSGRASETMGPNKSEFLRSMSLQFLPLLKGKSSD